MYDVIAYVLAQTKFGATFRKKSWNHRGYNNLSPIEITPVGQVLWQGYRVWDRSGEYSPWGQSIFYPHGTPPTPRRMTRYWSFKFLSPLFEKWNPTGSFFACWHLWKICPKGQNFVGFFKKKIGRPPPPPCLFENLSSLGEGFGLKMECPLNRNANDP